MWLVCTLKITIYLSWVENGKVSKNLQQYVTPNGNPHELDKTGVASDRTGPVDPIHAGARLATKPKAYPLQISLIDHP